MSREFTVTLGGQPITLRPLTIGQLEELSTMGVNAIGDGAGAAEARVRAGFTVLRLALKRAGLNVDEIEASPEKAREAIRIISENSGMVATMVKVGDRPGEAPPATGA